MTIRNIGGKELWKKIARLSVNSEYQVFVLDHGQLRLDNNGNPVIYDGNNIDDAELWSENIDNKYTLFALKV